MLAILRVLTFLPLNTSHGTQLLLIRLHRAIRPALTDVSSRCVLNSIRIHGAVNQASPIVESLHTYWVLSSVVTINIHSADLILDYDGGLTTKEVCGEGMVWH